MKPGAANPDVDPVAALRRAAAAAREFQATLVRLAPLFRDAGYRMEDAMFEAQEIAEEKARRG